MLDLEGDGESWRARLRAQGWLRLLGVPFLLFWLCGWAAGEAFALSMFLPLARWADRLPPELARLVPHVRFAPNSTPLPVLAFVALWLGLWTLGGLGALHTVFRLLFGADEVRWDRERVEVKHLAGLFGSKQRIAWADLLDLRIVGMRVVAETRRGLVPLVLVGTGAEREELVRMLREAWRASGAAATVTDATADESLPPGWRHETGADGREALVGDAKASRAVAIFLGLFATVFGLAGGAALARAFQGHAGGWAGVPFVLVAALMAFGALWIATARTVIHWGAGSLERSVRAFGRTWSKDFSPLTLRLEQGKDSDGDVMWRLVAATAGGREVITSNRDVPGDARRVGRWLAARTGVTLEGEPADDGEARRAV